MELNKLGGFFPSLNNLTDYQTNICCCDGYSEVVKLKFESGL